MLTLSSGPAEGGKDTCQGDSGGPLVTRATGVDDGYSLIGVVSWGYGCAVPGLYGVYAEFSKFLGWVEEVFNIPPPAPPSPWNGQNVTGMYMILIEDEKSYKIKIGCGAANVRIVGGEEAAENQLPWQCMIQNGDGSFYGCGATLISCDPVILVSAAHCFPGYKR